jgi:hypothetical protein
MNVEIGTEVVQFPGKEYINRIFLHYLISYTGKVGSQESTSVKNLSIGIRGVNKI